MDSKMQLVQDEINKVIKGKNDVVKKVLAAVIAGGHILMEDIPGVGKTTLAVTFAKTMSLDYKRVQFTPDVLPTDIRDMFKIDNIYKRFYQIFLILVHKMHQIFHTLLFHIKC